MRVRVKKLDNYSEGRGAVQVTHKRTGRSFFAHVEEDVEDLTIQELVDRVRQICSTGEVRG